MTKEKDLNRQNKKTSADQIKRPQHTKQRGPSTQNKEAPAHTTKRPQHTKERDLTIQNKETSTYKTKRPQHTKPRDLSRQKKETSADRTKRPQQTKERDLNRKKKETSTDKRKRPQQIIHRDERGSLIIQRDFVLSAEVSFLERDVNRQNKETSTDNTKRRKRKDRQKGLYCQKVFCLLRSLSFVCCGLFLRMRPEQTKQRDEREETGEAGNKNQKNLCFDCSGLLLPHYPIGVDRILLQFYVYVCLLCCSKQESKSTTKRNYDSQQTGIQIHNK